MKDVALRLVALGISLFLASPLNGLLAQTAHAAPSSMKTGAMRIEVYDPRLTDLIDPNARIETLVSGNGLGVAPAGKPDYGASLESPLWWAEGGFLLLSDIPNDRIMKWQKGKGLSVFLQPSGHANGLWRDPRGRLLICEHSGRQVSRIERDGSKTVMMRSYRGQRLNRPNTVIARSDGGMYFSDFKFRAGPTEDWDVDFEGIYYISADLGHRILLLRDVYRPHKLLLSRDEKVLFVGQRHGILAYDLLPAETPDRAGRLEGAQASQDSKRWFWKAGVHGADEPAAIRAALADDAPLVDGMKMDSAGNLYVAGRRGIWFISAAGTLLGHIDTGGLSTPNLAFGGDDLRTLFFVGNHALFSVPVKIAGAPIPTGPKARAP